MSCMNRISGSSRRAVRHHPQPHGVRPHVSGRGERGGQSRKFSKSAECVYSEFFFPFFFVSVYSRTHISSRFLVNVPGGPVRARAHVREAWECFAAVLCLCDAIDAQRWAESSLVHAMHFLCDRRAPHNSTTALRFLPALTRICRVHI